MEEPSDDETDVAHDWNEIRGGDGAENRRGKKIKQAFDESTEGIVAFSWNKRISSLLQQTRVLFQRPPPNFLYALSLHRQSVQESRSRNEVSLP